MPSAAIGPIIGGVTGLIGAGMASGAARSGSEAAQKALEQQRNDLAPWRQTGAAANTATSDLLGLNGQGAADAAMANFQQSPGYQWSFDQGMRAIDAGAASKGILRSGATIKAEQAFGTGLADQEFQQYYKNLFGLSALGENAAAGGSQTANASAALGQSAGNTQAGIFANTATGLGNTAANYFAPRRGSSSIFDSYNGVPGGNQPFY